jgi:hypothetical protein
MVVQEVPASILACPHAAARLRDLVSTGTRQLGDLILRDPS